MNARSSARHERTLCSCKLRLRRDEPDGRLTQWPSSPSLRQRDVDHLSLLEILKMNQPVPTLVLFYCSQRCCWAMISEARTKSSGHSAVFFALLCI